MRWVQQAAIRPHRCAVLPFVGNSNTSRGFIDTGSELDGWDNHVYISVDAVEEMARLLGWVPPHVLKAMEAKADSTQADLTDAISEIKELELELDAVQTLKAKGWGPATKPARKLKEAEAAS